MVRDATISLRVEPRLKELLEARAEREGRTLASLVVRILTAQIDPPPVRLDECHPVNRKKTGPRVAFFPFVGMPAVELTTVHARTFAKQLINAAKTAESMPPTG